MHGYPVRPVGCRVPADEAIPLHAEQVQRRAPAPHPEASMCRAPVAPRPGTAVHHRRRRGIRTVSAAKVPAAQQLPKLDRWAPLLAYICHRIVGPIGLPTLPPTEHPDDLFKLGAQPAQFAHNCRPQFALQRTKPLDKNGAQASLGFVVTPPGLPPDWRRQRFCFSRWPVRGHAPGPPQGGNCPFPSSSVAQNFITLTT